MNTKNIKEQNYRKFAKFLHWGMGLLAKQAHFLLVYTLFSHIAAALKHRFLDKSEADVLPRMLSIKPRV